MRRTPSAAASRTSTARTSRSDFDFCRDGNGAPCTRRMRSAAGRTTSPTSRATRRNRSLDRLDAWQARARSTATPAVPSHPITIALADALQHFAIPKSAFVALIDGCRQDIVKTRYETSMSFSHYCELVASSISDISLAIFGYRTRRRDRATAAISPPRCS